MSYHMGEEGRGECPITWGRRDAGRDGGTRGVSYHMGEEGRGECPITQHIPINPNR